MAKNDTNDKIAKDLADEAKKLGFDRVDEGQEHLNLEDDDDEDQDDEGNLDEEEDSDSEEGDDDEDSDDDSEDDSDDEEDSDEDEDDDDTDDSTRKKKKVIPFKAHNELRKELGKVKEQLEQALADNETLQSKLPDDYQQRVDELVKEIGVKDPDSLKKILDFTKTVVDNGIKKNETRLTELEKLFNQSRTVVDEFTTEWPTFKEKSFVKAFPNATPEQITKAEKLMNTLAHDKKTGGKLYKDEKTGKLVLDPYELDYIFYRNRSQFEAIVTGKKFKGMESARTRGITTDNDEDKEVKTLNKDSSAKDIRKMDKEIAAAEAGLSNLRAPEDNHI